MLVLEHGTTVVHSRILEWHTTGGAAAGGGGGGCTGRLMVVAWKRLHMAEKAGQSPGERCTGRVRRDGCSGSR